MATQLTQLVPFVRTQVHYLLQHRIASSYGLRVANVTSSAQHVVSIDGRGDRFSLSFTYCRTEYEWVVLFNCYNPEQGPDFIFPEGNEFLAFGQTALPQWTATRADSLCTIVSVLLTQFMHFQRVLASTLPEGRIRIEYDMMKEWPHLEFLVTVDPMTHRPRKARFFFPLNITIEGTLLEAGSSEGSASRVWLDLIFDLRSPDAPSHAASVVYSDSPLLAQLQLPSWTTDMSIITFSELTVSHIQQHFQKARDQVVLKQGFISAVQQVFGSPLEYDGVTYSKIVFAFELSIRNQFLVHFTLPPSFPDAPPIVKATAPPAVGVPNVNTTSITFSNFPYSPRWSALEMAQRLRAYLNSRQDIFQP